MDLNPYKFLIIVNPLFRTHGPRSLGPCLVHGRSSLSNDLRGCPSPLTLLPVSKTIISLAHTNFTNKEIILGKLTSGVTSVSY